MESNFELKLQVGAFFIDLSEAFDTLDHTDVFHSEFRLA